MSAHHIDREVNARGAACPGPLMELLRLVKTSKPGDVVAVISSDPGSARDIPIWTTKARHRLVAVEPVDGANRFVVEVLPR